MAHGPSRLIEWVLVSPGRSRDGNLLHLPEPAWFSKGIDEIQECFGFLTGSVSGQYTVVGRGAGITQLEEISSTEKLVLVNPVPEIMKQVGRLPHEIVIASQDLGILALARELSCETWPMRRTDGPTHGGRAVDRGDMIRYSLRRCYEVPVRGRFEYEIDHFLGPIPLLSLALREKGVLNRIIGWDQYLSPSFELKSRFARFRAIVGNEGFFDRAWRVDPVGGIQGFPSQPEDRVRRLRRFIGNLRRKLGQVLRWQPKFLLGVDTRHAIRNLVNIWICRLLLESGVRVDGLIVPLATSGKFWPRPHQVNQKPGSVRTTT